ncbi:MAG: ABC transporter ATP-binding protein, partial [Clostridia bacterium]|nr:ABC transporter ATP-binding protein [Clostridia bacterium]
MNSRMPGGIKMPGQKFDKATVKRLLAYIVRPYKLRCALIVILILINALGGVVTTIFLRTLIDDYITPMLTQANPAFDALAWAIARIAGICLAGVAAGFAYMRLMVKISQGALKTIRDDMFAHMQTLPVQYFDTHTHGDLMSHYTNDTDTLRQMISQSLPNMVSSVAMVIAVFSAMVFLSPLLALLVLVCIALMLKVSRKIAGQSGRFFVEQQRSLGQMNGYIEEMIHGQHVVKVFCHEEAAKENFDKLNEQLCKNATNANRFANILMPIMGNLGHLMYVVVAIAGGAMAIGGVGALTLGTIASFLQLTRSFVMPINQVSQQLNSVIMALAGAQRIFKLMDEPAEEDQGTVTLVRVREDAAGQLEESAVRTGKWAWKRTGSDGATEYTRLRGDVRLVDVDFGYEPGKPVLHDVSLYAKPGQKIAFVGATGAGKTTITNLLNRFYDMDAGQILYDGVDVRNIRKDHLRRSLGMVLQDTNLFTGTVMENIRYGKLDATDADVIAAAKLANAHDFITRLPKGYDTLLAGDGSGLSQGQRQLLSIARAAVANPPVMVLDEATSSIDTRTEAIVQRGMDQLMEGR